MISAESTQRIEAARLEEPSEAIGDVVAELSAATATLGKALHPRPAANLAGLVRIMNAYYSNLIEGHNTRPKDIERALAGNPDENEGRRNLQLEAAAHVRVHAEVDGMAAAGLFPEPASADFIRWLHGEFYRDAPPEMLRIRGTGREICGSFLLRVAGDIFAFQSRAAQSRNRHDEPQSRLRGDRGPHDLLAHVQDAGMRQSHALGRQQWLLLDVPVRSNSRA